MADAVNKTGVLSGMLERQRMTFHTPPQGDEPTDDDPPDDTPTDDVEQQSPESEDVTPEVVPPAEPELPPPPKLRFKSQLEAERAEEAAKRRMHEATQENARTRDAYAKLQAELEALKAEPTLTKEVSGPETVQPEEPPKKAGEGLVSFVRQMADLSDKLARADAESLRTGKDPTYAPEQYHADLAAVYEDIYRQGFQAMLPEIRQVAEEIADARSRAIAEELYTNREQQRTQANTEQDYRTQLIINGAKDLGFTFEGDDDLVTYFWETGATEADEIFGNDAKIEGKIRWALQKTQQYLSDRGLAGDTAAETPEDPPVEPPPAREPPRRPAQPMARQSATPTPGGAGEGANFKPRTLSQHLETSLERSRL